MVFVSLLMRFLGHGIGFSMSGPREMVFVERCCLLAGTYGGGLTGGVLHRLLLLQFYGAKSESTSSVYSATSRSGSVRVYNLPEKELVCHSEFASGGSTVLWAPTTIDQQAVTIIAGFTDGVVRWVGKVGGVGASGGGFQVGVACLRLGAEEEEEEEEGGE